MFEDRFAAGGLDVTDPFRVTARRHEVAPTLVLDPGYGGRAGLPGAASLNLKQRRPAWNESPGGQTADEGVHRLHQSGGLVVHRHFAAPFGGITREIASASVFKNPSGRACSEGNGQVPQ